jgi:flavin reductase (DIM6/NTAB) family NADH-FMN oxidoreductase RutF
MGSLRQLLRKVPFPVVVITLLSESLPRGITCSSFNSISTNPPIISFAINDKSTLNSHLFKEKKLAVNILSKDQINTAIAFSSKRTHGDFSNIQHYVMQDTPILHGTVGTLLCTIDQIIKVGDHYVSFCRVHEVIESLGSTSNATLEPLLYCKSSYRSIGDELFIDAFVSQRLSFKEWTHRAHVRMGW